MLSRKQPWLRAAVVESFIFERARTRKPLLLKRQGVATNPHGRLPGRRGEHISNTIGMWLRAGRPRNGRAARPRWCRRPVPRCGGHQRGVRRHSCPVRRRWLRLVHQLRGRLAPRPFPTRPRAFREHRQSDKLYGHPRYRVHAPPHRQRHGPIGMGSHKRLSNTTRKHELESLKSGAVGSAVGARGTGAARARLGQHQCSRSRVKVRKNARASGGVQAGRRGLLPSSQRLSKGALNKRRRRAPAIGKFIPRRQREPGFLQLRRWFASSAKLGVASSVPSKPATARGGGLPPKHSGDVGAGLAKYPPKTPSMPHFGFPGHGVLPSLRALRAAQPNFLPAA